MADDKMKIDRTKMETGETSERQDQMGRTPNLSFDTWAFNSPEEEDALRKNVRRTMNNRRDEIEEIPHDTIELGKGPKNPHSQS